MAIAVGLDTVELIMDAEAHFGVAVPDERLQKTETVGQFAVLLTELRAHAGKPLAYETVLSQLQELIFRRFGIPIERIVPEASFVKDLKLDQ